MLQRHTTKPQTLRFHLTHPCIELCRNSSPSHIPFLNFAGAALHITPRMCANPEPMLQRHTTKPQTLRFSSHTSLYWTLPEQLSMLHNTCVPTHPEDTPQNLRPQNVHLTHPSFELCRSSSPYYTTHVCQPWAKVGKNFHKTSDPKIFISHNPVLNFAEQLSMLHHTCEPTHPEPTSQDTLQTSIRKCSSHTSLFRTLPEQLGTDDTTHVCQPILNQHSKNTPQNLRPQGFHLTHPCFELCRSSSPYYTTHVCQPILSQRPKTHYKLQIRKFSSHTSLFRTLPEQLGTDDTTHVCQPWTKVTKTHHKTSDPKIFISHIPVLNFAGTALHITPRMCANPSWRHTTKSQTPRFSSHTSLFWTLPEQLSILHHACVPTLIQRPKDTPQNLRP